LSQKNGCGASLQAPQPICIFLGGKHMKNKKIILTVIALVAVLALMAGLYVSTRPKAVEGSKQVTIQIVHKDGTEKILEFGTDHAYLADLLLEKELVTGYASEEYGFTIESVDGVTADWAVDGAYWALYEGDEYATIGSVYKKGGKLKIVLIAVILFYIALGMFNGLCVWGGLGYNAKNVIDFNKSGMTFFKPNDEELAQIAAVDSDVVDAYKMSSLYKFHTKGCLQLSVKQSSNGVWTELDRQETNTKEGYLFITGDPSSCIELHIISDTSAMKYTTEINDNAYRKETTKLKIFDGEFAMYEGEEEAIALFLRNEKDWPEATDDMNELFFGEVLTETPPDGCYVVTVQDVK
jgi:flagellar basal body-associated protein FliL